MRPHLLFRVHADLRLGLGHVVRALIIHEQWRALGGDFTLVVSGDERARRLGSGRHPLLDEPLAFPVVDLGEDIHAAVPAELKASATIAMVDQWGTTAAQIQDLRPLKVAVMEDDGDAHEHADMLFQPFLEGISWPNTPVKSVNGKRVRPYETTHGRCRVLRGSSFIVVSPVAIRKRPKREPIQPLAVHKLLVYFGGSDNVGLAGKAHAVLANLVKDGRWSGFCTILAPGGVDAPAFTGCQVLDGFSSSSTDLQDYDAVWCSGGMTLAESLCLGVPVTVWAQDERQHRVIGDLALANGCHNLGVGSEADLDATGDALVHWLGPEGQETRQEQTRDGMMLVDGMGASRVAHEMWALADS